MNHSIFKKIASVLIVGLLLFPALHGIVPEDANLDNSFDLKDLISIARSFSLMDKNPDLIVQKNTIQTYVNAMQIVSGLKNAYQQASNSNEISSLSLYYLITESDAIITRLPDCGRIVNPAHHFNSFICPTASRPPSVV